MLYKTSFFVNYIYVISNQSLAWKLQNVSSNYLLKGWCLVSKNKMADVGTSIFSVEGINKLGMTKDLKSCTRILGNDTREYSIVWMNLKHLIEKCRLLVWDATVLLLPFINLIIILWNLKRIIADFKLYNYKITSFSVMCITSSPFLIQFNNEFPTDVSTNYLL